MRITLPHSARHPGGVSHDAADREFWHQSVMQVQSLIGLFIVFLAAPAHAGGVFWIDRGTSQLKRMNFDGSNLQTLTLSGAVNSPGTNIRGLAVDTISNQIFWADNGTDRLFRASLDGSSNVVLQTITGGNSFPADVRLDPENRLLYWCDQLRNRIQRSSFEGTLAVDVITNAAATGPYFMEIDPAAKKIYWGDFDDGSIFRANLDGSGRETLLTGNNRTRGVCLDSEEGMLYWINRDDKKVHRCPVAAFANGTIPLTHPSVQTLYAGLDTPHGLVLDIPARKLYWADTGSNTGIGSGDRAVSRGDLDGSTPLEVLASGSEPWDVDLDRRCSAYDEWRMRCFRRDAPMTQSSPGADPDGDGLPNALEYAWNLPPLHANLAAHPTGLLATGPIRDAVYAGLKFRRRSGTRDLVSYIQVSTNLINWSGSSAEPQTTEVLAKTLADGMEEITVRTLAPLSADRNFFLRLVTELKP